MGGTFLVLALVAATRVAIPAIDSDPSLQDVSARLHEHLVRQVEASGCAELVRSDDGENAFYARLAQCEGRFACMGAIAKENAVEHVLVGTLVQKGDVYHLDSMVIDMADEPWSAPLPGIATNSVVKLSGHLKPMTEAFCSHLLDVQAGLRVKTVVASATPNTTESTVDEAEGETSDETSDDASEESAPVAADLFFELPPELLDVLDASVESDADASALATTDVSPEEATPEETEEEANVDQGDATLAAAALNPPIAASVLPEYVQRRPLAFAALGAGVVTAIAGAALGMSSGAIWAGNETQLRDGIVHNSITREDARRANVMAVGANVLFGAAGLFAAGGATLLFFPTDTGAAVGGTF